MKKSIYIETTIFSYLTGKPSANLINAARQQTTNLWWENRRKDFRLFVALPVIVEASNGDSNAAAKRLAVIRKIPLIGLTPQASDLADFLIKETPFPTNAEVDALHIAIACVNRCDFILTWNFKHIANAEIRSKLEILAESQGYRLPTICTPEEFVY
jgi:hypothetical protein